MKIKEIILEEKSSETVEIISEYANKNGNYCIHFTDIEKIGINPKQIWKTPLGISSYPLKETWKVYNENLKNFPWGTDKKYIMLLDYAPNMKILNVNEIDKEQLKELERKVLENNWMDTKELAFAIMEASVNSPPFQWWNITRNIALNLANNDENLLAKKWNTVLRKYLGYDIIEDKKGYGIIHKNEPYQVLFLHGKAFVHIKTLLNPLKRK